MSSGDGAADGETGGETDALPAPLGRAALVAALLAALLVLGWWARPAGDTPFLSDLGAGHWIVYPLVPLTTLRPGDELEASFEREFELESPPTSAWLEARFLGQGSVQINGRPLLAGVGRSLVRREVSEALQRGHNRIVARVRRSEGPPALKLSLDLGEQRIDSDEGFGVSLSGAVQRPARRADRPVGLHDPSRPAFSWVWPAAFGLLAALGLLASARLPVLRGFGAQLPLAAIVGLWLARSLNNLDRYPPFEGFDVAGHGSYVAFLLRFGALPTPEDGPIMHHPPLFYLISAGLLRLFGLGLVDPSAAWLLRGFTCLLGCAHVSLLYACVRRVLPGRTAAHAAALLLLGFLPLHLYLFDFFTNETLAATSCSASIYLCLRVLQSCAPGPMLLAALGLCLGAALLTKITAFGIALLAPLAIAVAHRRRPGAALGVVAVMLAVSAWYYAPLIASYGTPFVGYVGGDSVHGSWQDPGLRVAGEYLSLGRALIEPWFAGYYGVLDGLYSTLWGDGLAGGATSRDLGPSWNHGLMRTGFLLALLPSLLIAIGALRGARATWRRPSLERLFLVGLALGMALAMVHLSLRYPSYATPKAFYVHQTLLPVCLAFALGFEWLRARGRWLAHSVSWGLGVWALTAWASFWIVSGATATLLQDATKRFANNDVAGAVTGWQRVLEREPQHAAAHQGLCRASLGSSGADADIAHCDAAQRLAPQDPETLFLQAVRHAMAGRTQVAIASLEQMRRRAPDDPRGASLLLRLLLDAGDREQAAQMAREWLRFNPHDSEARALVAGPPPGP